MSAEYGNVLKGLGLRRSAGRTGICYDNAMAESFFAALKNERVSRVSYRTREETRRDITRYIEFWYNLKRLHSAVGYRPPREVHAELKSCDSPHELKRSDTCPENARPLTGCARTGTTSWSAG